MEAMTSPKRKWSMFVFPAIFILVMAPIVAIALITFRPDDAQCEDLAALPAAPHSHGSGLASTVQDGMQLIFNVSPAAELYEVVDGKVQVCSGELSDDMKHVTVDVNDARLRLGERLPVEVDLTLRRADTGDVVVNALAPAMYAPGHGYHFGDNFLVPGGAAYTWTVVVSPVQALRQEGAQDLWLEPVTWEGEFVLDEDGTVSGVRGAAQVIGDVMRGGVHVVLSHHAAVDLYAVDEPGLSVPQAAPPGSTYFLVEVTDHVVNYEEKLVGADVTLTFAQGEDVQEVVAPPVISPDYGFHYGANVVLEPGTWEVTVTVGGLDFLRHAGAALSLPREPIVATFTYEHEPAVDAGAVASGQRG